MKKEADLPVIRNWHLDFLPGTSRWRRENSQGEIIRFASGIITSHTLEVEPSYTVFGTVYGGSYPPGHEIMTHTVTRLSRVLDITLAHAIAGQEDSVIIIETDRYEKFYLVLSRFAASA